MTYDKIPEHIMRIFEEKLAADKNKFVIPPPVFDAMKGEFLKFCPDEGILESRFPLMKEHLNPYGTMQGGMIAAAIDNTIGPLSMFVAPPNFTRNMDIKYRRVVLPESKFIYVLGRFLEKKGRQLFFSASVHDNNGLEYVSSKSMHWII